MDKIKRVTFGNQNEYKGKCIIAFIDILGFSKKILSNWESNENNPLDSIIEIKNSIPKLVEEDVYVIKGKDGTLKLDIRVTNRIQTISDSFIISYPIENPEEIQYAIGLSKIVKNIGIIWNKVLTHGYTIRGAISYADIYWNDKEVIGPAFIEAYNLEEKYASVSRVILSSSCNKIVLETKRSEFFSLLQDLFIKDIDGYTIINPSVLLDGKENTDNIINSVIQLKQQQSDYKIKEKYTSLIHYLNSKNNNNNELEEY